MSGRILIIDDEKDMLVLLERILAGAFAHDITQTDDPLQVPDLLKNNSFDVVITDLKMPHRNGIQILRNGQGERRDHGRYHHDRLRQHRIGHRGYAQRGI